MPTVMQIKLDEHASSAGASAASPPTALGYTECINGTADVYECNNVDLLSFVPLASLGCTQSLNDIWGWTDPKNRNEFAIVGCYDGTSFVNITEPSSPQVLGFLPSHGGVGSLWRDIKVRGTQIPTYMNQQ